MLCSASKTNPSLALVVWDTWAVFSRNSLSTCWRVVFVWLFDCSLTFCATLVFPLWSSRNIIKFLGLHRHTPLVPHLAWIEASTDTHTHARTQRREHNAERCVRFITQSHFMLLCCLMTMKPDLTAVSRVNRTWANRPSSSYCFSIYHWQLYRTCWIKQSYELYGCHSVSVSLQTHSTFGCLTR